MNLTEKILNSLDEAKDKTLKFEDKIYTYSQIAQNIRKAATLLKELGVGFSDRVALQLPKSMEFIYFHFANMLIGAITLPLNPTYSKNETEYFLSDSGSCLFITTKENRDRLKDVISKLNIKTFLIDEELDKLDKVEIYKEKPKTQPDDVAIIAYTSGTTGRSKGAMITHKNLITNMEALRKLWRLSDKDKLLHVLPIFHVHGLVVALQGGLNSKMDIVMHEKFDPMTTLKAIEKEEITLFMGVPTIYSRLVDALDKLEKKPDISSMRLFISGSAPLTKVLFERFYKLTGHRILERYGMSEAGMITSNPYNPQERIPLSVGYPLEGCSIKIVKDGIKAKPFEVGEVYIKGSNVFKGYWQMSDKTRESFEDGWFKSGDLGYVDESGRLFLVGRAKELIITGGLNVYPKEVENIIDSHPAVKESAVFGVEDSDFGERVEAAVVLNQKDIAPGELIDFCKKNLAHYKCPKQIHILEELPKNAMGKIQKNVLSNMFKVK